MRTKKKQSSLRQAVQIHLKRNCVYDREVKIKKKKHKNINCALKIAQFLYYRAAAQVLPYNETLKKGHNLYIRPGDC